MPAFDKLRNELDLLHSSGFPINNAFHQLVERYSEDADSIEHLLYLQEELERKGHKVTWPQQDTCHG